MPNGSWPVTPADKADIVELGRLLHKTVLEFATKKGELHVKIMAGACQYLMDLQDQKKAALGDDIFVAQKLLADTGLSEKIVEPFMGDEENKPVEGGVAAEETAAAAETQAEEAKVEETEAAAAEGESAEKEGEGEQA